MRWITSYDKAASVLKMLRHFVTEELFKASLHNYLEANMYISLKLKNYKVKKKFFFFVKIYLWDTYFHTLSLIVCLWKTINTICIRFNNRGTQSEWNYVDDEYNLIAPGFYVKNGEMTFYHLINLRRKSNIVPYTPNQIL